MLWTFKWTGDPDSQPCRWTWTVLPRAASVSDIDVEREYRRGHRDARRSRCHCGVRRRVNESDASFHAPLARTVIHHILSAGDAVR